MDRAENLVSKEEDKPLEVAHVKKALMTCGYPADVIAGVLGETAQSRQLSFYSDRDRRKRIQDNKGS